MLRAFQFMRDGFKVLGVSLRSNPFPMEESEMNSQFGPPSISINQPPAKLLARACSSILLFSQQEQCLKPPMPNQALASCFNPGPFFISI